MPDIPIRRHQAPPQYGLRFQNDLLPEDYFYRGAWRGDGDGARLRTHTCVVCGHRSATWAQFKAHRKLCGASGTADPELAALKMAALLEEEEEAAATEAPPPEEEA